MRVGVQLEWDIYVGHLLLVLEHALAIFDNADNGVGFAAQGNGFPGNLGIACKPAVPESVADDSHSSTIRPVFLGRKCPALQYPHAEHAKCILGYTLATPHFGYVAA